MNNKDWKQKRIDEINLEISKRKITIRSNAQVNIILMNMQILINSNAENFEQFKKERGEI